MSLRFRPLFVAAAALCLVMGAIPAGAVNDPRLPEQWGLATIGAPAAWSVGTGSGITIAVLDTGGDFGHEDLRAKLLPGRNFVEPGASAQDDDGHGSHVAGIAAAATANGVGVAGTAPNASILPVKVLDSSGRGSVDAIAAGIRWAAANGAHVINLSLGPNAVIATLLGSGLEDAVNEAWSRGSVVVLAAGNDFLFSSSYSTVNAIVVTATTRHDRLANYASAVGSAKWGISAPGGAGGANKADDILSSIWTPGSANSYEFLAGTSMATPFVAGAAAVLRGLGMSPQQTVDRLLATTKDLGSPGRDSTYGAGRLNLAAAVAGGAASPLPPAAGPPASAAGPTPAPNAKPAPLATNPAPPPAPTQPAVPTAPASGASVGAAPAPDTTAPTGPAEAAAPLPPPDQRRDAATTGGGGGGERPWLPLGGAALTLAGAGAGAVLVQRRARWA